VNTLLTSEADRNRKLPYSAATTSKVKSRYGAASVSSKCAGTHTRHQSSAGACSEGYEYGASRPAAGGVRERMDIWGKDVT